MPLGLLLIFVAFPLLELGLLIKLGQQAGFWRTMAVVLATGVLGVWVLRNQGLSGVTRLRKAMEAGKPPAGPVAENMLRSLAGILLILPGLITDAAGLALLVPPIQRWVAARLLARAGAEGSVHVNVSVAPENARGARPDRPQQKRPTEITVIEGEFERIEERTIDPRRHGPER